MTELPKEMYLTPSRRRWVLIFAVMLILFLVCAALAVGVWWEGKSGWPVILGAAGFALFFGFGAAVAVPMMFGKGSDLYLGEEGFAYRTVWRAHTIGWHQVGQFGVLDQRTSGIKVASYVTFDLPEETGRMANANRKMIGLSHQLPDTYGMKAPELAAMMDGFRVRAAGQRTESELGAGGALAAK